MAYRGCGIMKGGNERAIALCLTTAEYTDGSFVVKVSKSVAD